jgi:hypothetical protein
MEIFPMLLNRRQFSIAAGSSLLVPHAANAQTQPSLAALHEAAKKEGELTWYAVPQTSEVAERRGADQLTSAWVNFAATGNTSKARMSVWPAFTLPTLRRWYFPATAARRLRRTTPAAHFANTGPCADP